MWRSWCPLWYYILWFEWHDDKRFTRSEERPKGAYQRTQGPLCSPSSQFLPSLCAFPPYARFLVPRLLRISGDDDACQAALSQPHQAQSASPMISLLSSSLSHGSSSVNIVTH